MVKLTRPPGVLKRRIMTKVIDSVIFIDTFEQQCVMLKAMLQSLRLKDHVHNIGIEQSLRNFFLMNTKVLKTSINYTKMLVSVTNSSNSMIFLSLLWFLLLKYPPMTFQYLP